MAGHHNHNAGTTNKCVDSYPERLQGGQTENHMDTWSILR